MLLEPDGTYTYTANDQRLTEHVLQENSDTQAIDERNWTFNYDDLDQLASVTDNGSTLYSYPYNAIGNPTSATGPAAGVSPFRWQGEFHDASFGGYYMGAREGSARLHIFLSPDPSGEASDPNLYREVGNDPINDIDPDGLEAKRSSIGGSETTNFLSTKDVTTLPNGDRQITYRLLLNQETITSLGVGAPGYYAHSTTELASVQHVFSGPQAAQAEALADRFVASKVDSLNQMDVAQARVDNMKSNFGLIPFFSAIDNYQQGQPWKLDAALSVLAVLPVERVVGSTVSAVEASEAVGANAGRAAAVSVFDPQAGASIERIASAPQTGAGSGLAASAQPTIVTGSEWYDYFSAEHGAANVEWTSGSGRTVVWPDELPVPGSALMFRVRPPARSSTFASRLNSVVPKPVPDAIAHHVQPLGLNGLDNGAINGSWEFEPWHQNGHSLINSQVNQLPYGTEIRILPVN